MRFFKKIKRLFSRGRVTIISTSEHQDFDSFKVGDCITVYNHDDVERPPFGLYRYKKNHIVVILNPWKLCKDNEEYAELYEKYRTGHVKTFLRRIKHGYIDTRNEAF